MSAGSGAHIPHGRLAVATLAFSLIFIEFLAGMQRYLSQTVLPLAASELDGAHLYGPLDAAAQAPMFLMMPVGAWLLSRFKVGHLMGFFTGVTVAGSVLSARGYHTTGKLHRTIRNTERKAGDTRIGTDGRGQGDQAIVNAHADSVTREPPQRPDRLG